jgi:hypothetical protein
MRNAPVHWVQILQCICIAVPRPASDLVLRNDDVLRIRLLKNFPRIFTQGDDDDPTIPPNPPDQLAR